MKQSLQCPKCAGRKIWHIPELKEHGEGDLPCAQSVGVLPGRWIMTRHYVGKIEAFVCAACGFMEHYAYDLDQLGKTEAQLLDNEPKATLR